MSAENTGGQNPAAPVAAPSPIFGGQPPATQNTSPPPQQQAASAPAVPPTVPLTVDEYNRLRGLESQFADFQRQQQAAIDAARAKENEALAAKGQIEEAFTAERTDWKTKLTGWESKFNDLRGQYHGEKVNAELASNLNGVTFAGADEAQRSQAARMFTSTLRDQFEVLSNPDGSTAVVDKASRRPAADVIRERLSDPTLAFLFAPTTRGGSGTDATRSPATQQQAVPGSLESIAAAFNAGQGQQQAVGLKPRSRT